MLEKVKPAMLSNKNYTSTGMALSSRSGSSSIDFIPGLLLVYIFDSYKNSRLIRRKQEHYKIRREANSNTWSDEASSRYKILDWN
jgi:hypothetical protein